MLLADVLVNRLAIFVKHTKRKSRSTYGLPLNSIITYYDVNNLINTLWKFSLLGISVAVIFEEIDKLNSNKTGD